MQAANVLDFEQEAWRERPILLVERDLERVPAVRVHEVALERERPIVEEQAQEHQAPVGVRGGRGRKEVAFLRTTRQRAAFPPLPAARLQPQEVVEPRTRVFTGLELSPREPALLAE